VINDWGCRASIGSSVEDAMFAAHMIAKQIPYRYPNIRFIVPRLGGPIPMLLNQLDTQGVGDLGGLPELPSATAASSGTTQCAMAQRPQ
jgi:6-methylsalicylate decarboxylase